jgi:hypothetical protein
LRTASLAEGLDLAKQLAAELQPLSSTADMAAHLRSASASNEGLAAAQCFVAVAAANRHWLS